MGWKTPRHFSQCVMEEDDKMPGMCRGQEQCHCCDNECESFRFIQEVGETAVTLEGATSRVLPLWCQQVQGRLGGV